MKVTDTYIGVEFTMGAKQVREILVCTSENSERYFIKRKDSLTEISKDYFEAINLK